MKTDPRGIWNEYNKIQEYMNNHDLFEIVKQNEKFYEGKQWEGVKTEDMPKPVINFLQRVVKHMIARLSSNEIAITIEPFTVNDDDIDKIKPISEEVEKIIERTKLKEKSRLAIRNAAVDGSAYMMQYFDAEFDTGQEMKGRVMNKLIDNTNMYFGNPYSNEIQEQPYIIVAFRQYIDQVKEEAESLGLSKEQIDEIKPDSDTNQANDDSDDLVTVLIKFYKHKKKYKVAYEEKDLEGNPVEVIEEKEKTTIWFTKTTQTVTLIEPTDLGYKRYPISSFGWDPMKNSFLYNSPLTAVIPNQIFVNKSYAIAQMYGLQSAFPKIVYDKNKVKIDGFLKSTQPHAVAGLDMMGKFLDFIKVPDFSSHIMTLIDSTINQTQECMGVNDAALGDMKPDNTSAIIALQETSNMPLEIQRQSFYEFWEDSIRNILDIMANTYGVRQVIVEHEGEKTIAEIDYSLLKNINYEVKVDIGNGSQYSEIAQVNTLDNLFSNRVIDAPTYIDSIPSKYVPNKGKISQYVDKVAKQQEEMIQQQMMMQNQPMVEGGIVNAQ